MTERERYTERGKDTTPAQREIIRDTTIDTSVSSDTDTRRAVSREHVTGPHGAYEVRRERVVMPSEGARQAGVARRIQQVISFIIGTIVVLLIIRFVLLLLGANQASSFVQLIYGVTQPLTAPFQGIFGEPVLGASVIEWASLVAIICFSLIGFGLRRLVDVIYKPIQVRGSDEGPLDV